MTSRPLHVLLLATLTCCAHTPPPDAAVTASESVSKAASKGTEQAGAVAEPPSARDRSGVAEGQLGAVSVAEPIAADIGLGVLRDGGNAIDAAIAIGFALAVTHPTAGNLGGGGFMLLRTSEGKVTSIDYRETAPSAARRDMYLDVKGNPTTDSLLGPRAAGIPGTVAGFALAHKKYGSLPFERLVMPAVRLAEEGHSLDALHARSLKNVCGRMEEVGLGASAHYYQRPSGEPLVEGERWRQPELAWSLRQIAESGSTSFYKGKLAERLIQGVQALGGLWKPQDLSRYQAKERPPLSFDYRNHRIYAMPLPSAGGIVLRQIMSGREFLGAHKLPYGSPAALHLYAEAARRAYADRNMLLGDPDFIAVPVQKLTSLPYIHQRVASVNPNRATPSTQINPGIAPSARHESHDTTHFSVVDRFGNAVSNTYTLNTRFGAKVVVPGTGILLNNEMDDFATTPGQTNVYGLVQGEENRIEPGKRMLSSMTPTIIERSGQLRAVLGSPGGPTITNTVGLITSALIDYNMSLQAAVEAPRLHHQWLPDQILLEPGFAPGVREGLRVLGHVVQESPYGPIGHANCIEVDPKTKTLRAVADVTRGKGGAARAY